MPTTVGNPAMMAVSTDRPPDDPSDVEGAGTGRWGRSRRHLAWSAATLALVTAGVGASLFAATAVAGADSDRARERFDASSANIASTLELALQHEDDLVVAAGAFLSAEGISQAEFARWIAAARVVERYPEVSGVAGVFVVDDADLPAFAIQAEADPAGALAPDGTFQVVPQGKRPFYCLVRAAVATGPAANTPAGSDYCANPLLKSVLLDVRDSGLGAYLPYLADGTRTLAIQTPIYRGGTTPARVASRREAFIGVVATQIDPAVVLERALQGQRGLSVSMRYQGSSAMDVTFTSGTRPAGGASASIDLNNGWTIRTLGTLEANGVAHGNALVMLLAGIAVSLLLGLLMFVLGTGRERARRQLHQRTGELHHQALHDPLTGLPNRALVMDRLEQMLARDRRGHTTGAALFLDVDDFKNVNDTLGHGAGDRLLIAVAARLANTLRGMDTIGRMGGDEFVVLIDRASLDVAPELVAQRLLDVMSQPFELDDTSVPLKVNMSIGVATATEISGEELLRQADVALYQAKGAGKNRFAIFDADVESNLGRHTDLEFDLRTALAGHQYRLAYQPIYNLEDLTVVGAEALLRWDHPKRGLIGPDEFIPMLEQSGHIREVGRWVLMQACQQMATWHARGDVLDISVNVSGLQLDDDDITDDIRDALRATCLDASALIIEITETALMRNLEVTARRLGAIKELGVRIAIDDFGTGYSSLAYLRQFPVDCLKIDRAFTSAATRSTAAKALVSTLVQLGKDLGLSTLAEGIETTDELDIMRGTDVDQAQGFLMARPLDPDTFEARFLGPHRVSTPTQGS